MSKSIWPSIFFELQNKISDSKKPAQEMHHGHLVWVNKIMDGLRREQCLCLNCANLKPNQSDNCYIAQELYQICVKGNVAIAMTRCPLFREKK